MQVDVLFLTSAGGWNMAAGCRQVCVHSVPRSSVIPVQGSLKTWYELTEVTSNTAQNHLVLKGPRLLRLLMLTARDVYHLSWSRLGANFSCSRLQIGKKKCLNCFSKLLRVLPVGHTLPHVTSSARVFRSHSENAALQQRVLVDG